MSCADELDDARSELAKLDVELTALTEEIIILRAENERMRAALLLIKNGSDGNRPALNIDEIVDTALNPPKDSRDA